MTPTSPKAEAERLAEEFLEKQSSIVGNYDDDTLREAVLFGYSAASSRWIPVSERLPEESGGYLTAHDYGGISVQTYAATCKQWNAYDYDYENKEKNFMKGITHWQHLPKPPTEQP